MKLRADYVQVTSNADQITYRLRTGYVEVTWRLRGGYDNDTNQQRINSILITNL
ncbi:hypothetical protein [Flavobacterium antarcticum]|uniref:hypothetical protein n=1 Tax=Flavobacterium antarcticum TaxID=271155 RepID=UPI0012F81A83|nr:hypothetical protein [Flavobacterium antarcticum]